MFALWRNVPIFDILRRIFKFFDRYYGYFSTDVTLKFLLRILSLLISSIEIQCFSSEKKFSIFLNLVNAFPSQNHRFTDPSV